MQVEGFYQTSEDRKQSLKEELEQLKKEHDKLRGEKTELSKSFTCVKAMSNYDHTTSCDLYRSRIDGGTYLEAELC